MSRRSEPLGPWWLERQLDLDGPELPPGGTPRNVTHRDWLQLGTVGRGERGVVDPRGLVTAGAVGWSLDWWIGADDRWHVPAREVAVRQRRIDDAPVVETVMRVPGGDAVHRGFAAHDRGGPVLVVEVENATPVPFALALVVVPYTAAALGRIAEITLEGEAVHVDGRAGVVCGRAPARVLGHGDGDPDDDLLAGVERGEAAPPRGRLVVRDGRGRAGAAFVFPVAHRSGVRVAMPLGEGSVSVSALPSAREVARGWAAQVRRGARFEIPDERVAHQFEGARRDLLLMAADEDVVVWPDAAVPWTVSAVVVDALGRMGFDGEASRVLGAFPDEQRLDGSIVSADDVLGANGAVLWALARHWERTRDDDIVERLVGPIAKAGHWIDKRRAARRRNLLVGARPLDVWWSVAGLQRMSTTLARTGQPEVAEDFSSFARRLAADFTAARPDRDREPGPRGDEELRASWLQTAVPAPMHERLAARAASVAARCSRTALVADPGGLGSSADLTLALGRAELAAGDRSAAWARLQAVVDHSSPVGTWPTVVHPATGGGTAGSGQDAPTVASLSALVRDVLVGDDLAVEHDGPRLDLCNVVPDAWLGRSWEAHDVPTVHGRLGFAVRWHGDRPALLWELDPHDAGTVVLRAPGLDPRWSSTAPEGEALLGPIAPPRAAGNRSANQGGDPGGAEASSSFA